MDEEIVLDRGNATVMKLDADEQALMDEIHISAPRMQMPKRPAATPSRRPQPGPPPQEEIDAFANPNKQAPPPRHEAEEVDYGEDEQMFYDDDEEPGAYEQHQEERPSNGFTSVDEEKADILNKLARLEKKGFNVNKRLNAYSSIEELRTEVKRVTYSIEVEQSVKFSKRMLVACVTGLEFLNKRYNPFELHLDGWSESVMENQDDYDNVFEELYVKYRSKVNVAPEIKLIMMLGGSAMMFHLTSSMMKAALPNMNDVLKQNPDLMKNMVQAVQSTASQRDTGASPSPDGQYEMQGPGIDISRLMGGIMMPPPPPMNTSPMMTTRQPEPVQEDDDVSDIVSVSGESTGGEVKEVSVSATSKPKRTRRKKKTEINL